MNYFKKLATGIAMASLVMSSGAPVALAAINVTVSGNSGDSTVTVDATSDVSVEQGNLFNVDNTVIAEAKTGKNVASSNTGSGVTIATGNATANSSVINNGGNNDITVEAPPAPPSSLTSVAGNSSTSTVTLTLDAFLTAGQGNLCIKKNTITKKAKTGKNTASSNTGGTVGIATGVASATGSVTNNCGNNTLSL